MAPEVREMVLDEEVASTFPVMCQLRPPLGEEGYVGWIREVRQGGYRLAVVVDDGQVRCVAGFRIQDYLSGGEHLYVDDLVTARGRAFGGLWQADARLARRRGEEEWVRAVPPGRGCAEARHPQVLPSRGDKITTSYHFSTTL